MGRFIQLKVVFGDRTGIVTVNTGWPVEGLRAAIADRFHINANNIQHNGQTLENDRKIGDCGLTGGEVIIASE